jgi:hypothetical protein
MLEGEIALSASWSFSVSEVSHKFDANNRPKMYLSCWIFAGTECPSEDKGNAHIYQRQWTRGQKVVIEK